MAKDIIKNIPLTLDINARKRLDGTVDIRLYSKDIATGQFEFTLIDENENPVVLDETYSAQALVKYEGNSKTYLNDMIIEGNIIRFIFPHDFITKDGTITMYIYITKDSYTSDVAAISFPVFVSEIDKDLDPSISVHYIGKIEQLIEDMRKEIDDQKRALLDEIMSNTDVGDIDNYYQQFTDVITALSEEKDYHSLPEISGARGGFDTLGERLKDTDTKLSQTEQAFNKAVSEVTVDSEVILARGGEDTLGTRLENIEQGKNLTDKSISTAKLNIDGYLPMTYKFNLGDLSTPGSPLNRASTEIVFASAGTRIETSDQVQIAVMQSLPDGETKYIHNGWVHSVNVPEDMDIIIRARLSDDSDIDTSDLSLIKNKIYKFDEETAVKRKDLLPVKEQIDTLIASMNPDNFSISDLGRRNENIIFNGLATESIPDTSSYSDAYIRENSMTNTEIVDKKIVIKPGGYWFIRFNPSAFVNESKLTVRFNMLQGYQVNMHSIRLEKETGTNSYTYMQSSTDKEISVDLPGDIGTYQRIEIRFDNRTGTEDVILEYLLANTYDNVNLINLGMSLAKPSGVGGLGTKYVSLTGSDGNSGDSMSDGYATLQKALQELNGIGTIVVERGIYYGQSVSYEAKDIKILAHTEPYDGTKEDRQLAEFRGSDTLSGWVANSGVYRIPYSGNTRFDMVFVDKTLPIETTSSRKTYNAVLWEGNDGVSDYKMKPVLTLAECQSEIGTFFYDGSYLYINPKDVNKEFNAVKTDTGFNLAGDNVTLHDLKFDFYTGVPMRLYKIKNLVGQNCGASHSSTGNGFGFDYTNATMTNCLAHKNRNDGFNMHFYGDTTLINCKGLNNYDDGVSHHEDCTGTIIGGEYSGNGKGGIIPVNGSTIQVYGAVIENNRFGFYTESPNALSHGNFYKDNEEAIVNLADTPIRSINDVFVNNPNREGNLTLYNETIL